VRREFFGIVKNYIIWTWNGEILDIPTISGITEHFEEGMNDHFGGHGT